MPGMPGMRMTQAMDGQNRISGIAMCVTTVFAGGCASPCHVAAVP